LTGKVFDPAGVNPLYNALVYVPALTTSLPTGGISNGTHACGACGTPLVDHVVATVTDATGSFSLAGVPTGKQVPVTVQIGKWLRTTPIDITASCATTPVPDGTLRLPGAPTQGNLPRIAFVSGGGDDLGCFLRRIGITSFANPFGPGAVNVFRGVSASSGTVTAFGPGLSRGSAGDCTTSACPLWASRAALDDYDMVLLSCEGDPYSASKPAAAIQTMHDYVAGGGKLLAIHSQAIWFQDGPSDFQSEGEWQAFSNVLDSGSYSFDTAFPKGAAFQRWMGTSGPVSLSNVSGSLGAAATSAASWLMSEGAQDAAVGDASLVDGSSSDAAADGALAVKALSFGAGIADGGTPCGKAVFSDIHPGTAPEGDLPDSCQMRALSPEERALEFLFFDLSACVQDDRQAPSSPQLPL
jgi:hypothetical protein